MGTDGMGSYRMEAEGMKPVREKNEIMNIERTGTGGMRNERVRAK